MTIGQGLTVLDILDDSSKWVPLRDGVRMVAEKYAYFTESEMQKCIKEAWESIVYKMRIRSFMSCSRFWSLCWDDGLDGFSSWGDFTPLPNVFWEMVYQAKMGWCEFDKIDWVTGEFSIYWDAITDENNSDFIKPGGYARADEVMIFEPFLPLSEIKMDFSKLNILYSYVDKEMYNMSGFGSSSRSAMSTIEAIMAVERQSIRKVRNVPSVAPPVSNRQALDDPRVFQREKRGRHRKWDWEGALLAVIAKANTSDGLPEGFRAHAEICKIMTEWFEKTQGGSPASSEIGSRASRILDGVNSDRK